MNWCEHITLEYRPEGCFWSFLINKRNYSVDDFMMCPICGAKRPERKGLAEKLRIAWLNHDFSGSSLSVFEQASKVAIDHACEVIDKHHSFNGWVNAESLKQAIRDSI